MGRSLGNAMLNIGASTIVRNTLRELGVKMEDLSRGRSRRRPGQWWPRALGRLLHGQQLRHLQLPVTGYGIRYEYGMFRQRIENGNQVEDPDHWLALGNVWEVARAEYTPSRSSFGGRSEPYSDDDGSLRCALGRDRRRPRRPL